MAARRDYTPDLQRIERKLDRLTHLVVLLLLCQPILLVGTLLPEGTLQAITLVLLALLAFLFIFPNIERKFPLLMRRLGRLFGRLRRWTRVVTPG
jgi:hypothetical protein